MTSTAALAVLMLAACGSGARSGVGDPVEAGGGGSVEDDSPRAASPPVATTQAGSEGPATPTTVTGPDDTRWPRGVPTPFVPPRSDGANDAIAVVLPNGLRLSVLLPPELDVTTESLAGSFSVEYSLDGELTQQSLRVVRGPVDVWLDRSEFIQSIGFDARALAEYRRVEIPAGSFLVEQHGDWLVWRMESSDPPRSLSDEEARFLFSHLDFTVDSSGYLTVAARSPVVMVSEDNGQSPAIRFGSTDWTVTIAESSCAEIDVNHNVSPASPPSNSASLCDARIGVRMEVQTHGALDASAITTAIVLSAG